MDLQQARYQAPGAVINYAEGPADGLAFVVLHGGAGRWRQWEGLSSSSGPPGMSSPPIFVAMVAPAMCAAPITYATTSTTRPPSGEASSSSRRWCSAIRWGARLA